MMKFISYMDVPESESSLTVSSQESKLFLCVALPFSTHNFRSQSISIKVVKMQTTVLCLMWNCWIGPVLFFFLLSPSLPFLLPSSLFSVFFLLRWPSCQDCFIFSLLLLGISSTYSVCSDKLLLTFRLSLGTVSLLFIF